MQIKQPLGDRIRFLLVTYTFIISLFFSLILLGYAWLIEDNVFNRLVAQEASYISATFRQKQDVVEPRLPFMTLYSDWTELPLSVQKQRARSPERIEFPNNNGGTLHLTTILLGDKEWVLAADVSVYEVSKDYFPFVLRWILVAIAGITLGSYLISRYLTNQIVQPIQTMTNQLIHHSEKQLLTFDYQFKENEIGYLANSITKAVNQLYQTLERESQFTRDISHELRTPTAVLSILAEKLQSNALFSEQSQLEFRHSVQQIHHTLNVLLALARDESLQTETVNINRELEFCIINHPVLAQDNNAQIALDMSEQTIVETNKNLLHIMINNLLDNGLNHSSVRQLHITLGKNQMKFSNPVENEVSTQVLQDGYKSDQSEGMGLGLHLIQRICDRLSWSLTITSQQGNFSIRIEFS